MEQGDPDSKRVSWRKRHPRVSRALLYGVLVALALTAYLLLQERHEQDAADHQQYLESRLGMFDLLFGRPEGRAEILDVIEAEGMLSEGVPATVRQHAWRVKAQVHFAESQLVEAFAALDEAQALVMGEDDERALRLERSEVLVADGRADEALALLAEDAPWGNALLELARADGMAYVLLSSDRKEAARLLLDLAMDDAPTPLVPATGPRVGVRPLEAGPVAMRATMRLAALEGTAVTPEAARRLAALAPDHVQALRLATKALLLAGKHDEATRLWGRARVIDPPLASSLESKDPDLRFREAPLKGGDGRRR